MFFFSLLVLVSQGVDAELTVSEVCPLQTEDSYSGLTLTVFNATCYGFFLSDYSDYDDANAKCRRHNGTLAMPKTKQMNDFLVRVMKDEGVSSPMWIGMNDRKIEAQMDWQYGSTVEWNDFALFTHNWFENSEDCIAIFPSHGTWYDYDCVLKKPFICEYQVQGRSGNDGIKYDQEGKQDGVGSEEDRKNVKDGDVADYSGVDTHSAEDSDAVGSELTRREACPKQIINSPSHLSLNVFKGTCYSIVLDDDSGYSAASIKCRRHHGTLAMPKTKEVHDFLMKVMKDEKIHAPMWIGMNDLKAKNGTLWNDGSKVEWSNFGWLSIWADTDECVALNPRSGTWHHYDCCREQAFICEYRAQDKRYGDEKDDDQAVDSELIGREACPLEIADSYSQISLNVYNDTCYGFVLSGNSDYGDAIERCRQYNGTLAMPNTKAVNDFMVEVLRYLDVFAPIWIGINDKKVEREMVWGDGSSLQWQNFDWFTNGWWGNMEDCVALNPFFGNWHDYNCSLRKPFICEFDVKEESDDDDKKYDD